MKLVMCCDMPMTEKFLDFKSLGKNIVKKQPVFYITHAKVLEVMPKSS